ncbi:MAG: hypothetical protein LKI58_09140 [Actinomyces sp.]|jgi:hypothetical protein|nr:hypothetical protein [Actinomyces sp.]MCI1788216.1 hypothetical protein [Actinomyces sp.]MCI1830054.1 hypothetical protein [Actinomyces sp.]MCI1866493.1 hypothetical protein [Actinomyces sp.]
MQVEKSEVPKSRGWEPMPLSNALFGHQFTGLIRSPFVALFLWGLSFLPQITRHPFEDLVFVAIVATLIAEIPSTLIDRVFSIHFHNDDPATLWPHILSPIAHLMVGFAAGFLLFGGVTDGIACGSSMALVHAAEIVWRKPWRGGMTREVVAEKWEATKEMTREVFGDDIREVKRRAADSQRRHWESRIDTDSE